MERCQPHSRFHLQRWNKKRNPCLSEETVLKCATKKILLEFRRQIYILSQLLLKARLTAIGVSMSSLRYFAGIQVTKALVLWNKSSCRAFRLSELCSCWTSHLCNSHPRPAGPPSHYRASFGFQCRFPNRLRIALSAFGKPQPGKPPWLLAQSSAMALCLGFGCSFLRRQGKLLKFSTTFYCL